MRKTLTTSNRDCKLNACLDQKPIFIYFWLFFYSSSFEIWPRPCGICPHISLFIYFPNSLLFTLNERECQNSWEQWKPIFNLPRSAQLLNLLSNCLNEADAERQQTDCEHDTRVSLQQTRWCEHAILILKLTYRLRTETVFTPTSATRERCSVWLELWEVVVSGHVFNGNIAR